MRVLGEWGPQCQARLHGNFIAELLALPRPLIAELMRPHSGIWRKYHKDGKQARTNQPIEPLNGTLVKQETIGTSNMKEELFTHHTQALVLQGESIKITVPTSGLPGLAATLRRERSMILIGYPMRPFLSRDRATNSLSHQRMQSSCFKRSCS